MALKARINFHLGQPICEHISKEDNNLKTSWTWYIAEDNTLVLKLKCNICSAFVDFFNADQIAYLKFDNNEKKPAPAPEPPPEPVKTQKASEGEQAVRVVKHERNFTSFDTKFLKAFGISTADPEPVKKAKS